MLNNTLFASFRAEYNKTIDMLGVPMQWSKADASATANIVAGLKIAGDKDEALINAYGTHARIFTFKASDFPSFPPAKFDRITVGAEVFVAEAVQTVHLNGAVVGYRIYVRGK